MADAICFWSFLSLQNLDILHVSPTMGSQTVLAGHDTTIEDLILHHSLLDFIHPDEILLAKQDLSTFLQRKTLAGAVTRCRLLSFASIAKRAYPSQFDDDKASTWNIVDVVMYIVTEGVVLAFFHNQASFNVLSFIDNCKKRSSCGESYFTPKDAGRLFTVLQTHQPFRSDHTITPISSNTNNNDNNSTVDRVLQLYDKCSKQRLLSWPPSDQYYNPVDGQHLYAAPSISPQQLQQYHTSVYDRSSCMQHVHSQTLISNPPPATSTSPINRRSTTLANSSSYCQLERIVISYGCIIFYSFQINYPQPTKSFQHHQQQTTEVAGARNYIDLPHLFESRKLPEIALPSIITNNHSNYSMSTTVTPIESQHYNYPLLSSHRHLHQVSTPLYHHPHLQQQQQQNQIKRCVQCGTRNSPEWRRGPTGHKTLCNACGLRHSRLMSKKHNTLNNNKGTPRRHS